MERMQHILLFSALFITGVKSKYYFVTAPNVIRFEHDETVVVSVFDLTNAAVSVWLQHNGQIFSQKLVTVSNETHPVNTTLKITEKHIYYTEIETEKPRQIDVCSRWSSNTHCRKVVLSYRTGYLIVQTDKPIYTPLQKVNVRTLALDESLKGVTDWQVGMDIVTPSNKTIARRTVTDSNNGFYSNQFTLPDFPELGIWTARAFYRGQFETESRSLFEVKEYVLPTFGVTIDIDVPYILNDTTDILITVKARYVYGKPVRGNARLSLYLKEQNGIHEYILDVKKKPLQENANEGVSEFKIPVDDIRNSPLLKEQAFPYDGKRLEVIAFVYESATGKEEASSNENTIFTLKPFIFKFTRSRLNFRPGMEYYLKIDMLHANGQPATKKAIKVHMYQNKVLDKSEDETTDIKGQALSIFATTSNSNSIYFMAETFDGRYQSEHFTVYAYSGKNQIQVENSIQDNEMLLRAFTNTQGSLHTGMMFMVVSRGKIVYKTFKQTSNKASERFDKDLQEKITPSARFLVFYVDKRNNELVADSVKFDVEKKCRGEGLELKTEPKVSPGSTDTIEVTGSPFTWVGFNIMDKALFLLNDKNVLRKEKMFEVLESHDLGCGEGSGKSSAEVFKNSGLTILTNAKVTANDLARNSDGCNGRKRRKRADEDCLYGADNECCNKGKMYANESYHQNNDKERIDAYTVCYAKARELAKNKTFSAKCIVAYFVTCRESIDDLISDTTDITSKSFTDESDYASDLELLARGAYKPTARTDFRESWLFEIDQLSSNGQLTKTIGYPSSVTEWMIQAVGITPDKGMCIADEYTVNAFREFFIQLDLPYKAVRMENFDVKATIFNYKNHGNGTKAVNVYLHGVENLCSNIKPGMVSPRVQIQMLPNSAQTVNFPVVPLKKGTFPIRVSAFSTESGIQVADVIEKRLFVVNEGVQEQVTINVCLHQNSPSDDCRNDNRVKEVQRDDERVYEVDLTLPEDSIPQTGGATAYLQSNVMETVALTIQVGVESLFRAVSGCCEQKFVRIAPLVYAMNYMHQTNQMTGELRRKGTEYIRKGVSLEIAQHLHSSGYFYCNNKQFPCTWLTAFAAKMFCQAKKIVPSALNDNKDIRPALDWLTRNMNDDGSFEDLTPLSSYHMGQSKQSKESLTAFVLITFMECGIRTNGFQRTVQRATNRLEGLSEDVLKADPFLLAISTYALALTNSPSKFKLKRYLHEIQRTDEKDIFWSLTNNANSYSVETTAYALLAMQTFNDIHTSKYIVRWLVSQRNPQGSFSTTQNTVVALQALAKYTILNYTPDVDIKVILLAHNWHGPQLTLARESLRVQKMVRKIPVEGGDNELVVKVSGTGNGIMSIDLRYNRPATEEESCPFEISDIVLNETEEFPIEENLAKELNCDVCGCQNGEKQVEFNTSTIASAANHEDERRRREAGRKGSRKTCVRFSVSSKDVTKKYGMSIVKFGLQTGVDVVKEDLMMLMKSETNIGSYEMPSNGKGFIAFYLKEISASKTNFIFRLEDNYEGDKLSRHPSRMYVYDYYSPEHHCSKFYDIVPRKGESIRYECDKIQRQCQCVQSICVKPIEQEIIRMAKNRRLNRGSRPALLLRKYTCNSEKTNYAVRVKIESLVHEKEKGWKVARGTVLEILNQGIEELELKDELTFYWNEYCDHPSLEKGKGYFILGKDGNLMNTNQGQEYRYPLTGSALVIRDETKRSLLKKTLGNYKMLMHRSGCQN